MPSEIWKLNGEICPRCKGKLQGIFSVIDKIEYEDAERCPSCKWQASFTKDVKLSTGYVEITEGRI